MTAPYCVHDEGEPCDCTPPPPPATQSHRPVNRQAARARHLATQGWGTDRIADELGCARRSVQRYLQEAT